MNSDAIAILVQTGVIAVAGWLAWSSAISQIAAVKTTNAQQQAQFDESMERLERQQKVASALSLLDAFDRKVPHLYGELSPAEAIQQLGKMKDRDLIDVLAAQRAQYDSFAMEPEDIEVQNRFRKSTAAASIINNYFMRVDAAVEGGIADRKLMYSLGYVARTALPLVKKTIAMTNNTQVYEEFVERWSNNVAGEEPER